MLALSHHVKIGIATVFAAAACYSFAAEPDVTVPPQARPFMLTMLRPTYPVEAGAQHITGRGVYVVYINPATGGVTRLGLVERLGLVFVGWGGGRGFGGGWGV